jgi:hypothetical protein
MSWEEGAGRRKSCFLGAIDSCHDRAREDFLCANALTSSLEAVRCVPFKDSRTRRGLLLYQTQGLAGDVRLPRKSLVQSYR